VAAPHGRGLRLAQHVRDRVNTSTWQILIREDCNLCNTLGLGILHVGLGFDEASTASFSCPSSTNRHA